MTYVPPFQKILIANRGEIAIRIARASTELGIRTVSIYSHEDRFALHRFKTDESYKVGIEGKPLDAYLNIDGIIKVALNAGAEAIHPGYGFLSESAELAEKCAENNIVFVGPSPEVLRAFGDKVAARRTATLAGLKIIPGTAEPLKDLQQATELGLKMGFPLTLKAVSGGGGKGIRMVEKVEDLKEAFARSSSEAMSSFGRADLYIEKKIVNPKHIEVQILGDKKGHIVHLHERDCSIQRRHQKVVEVAPAIGLADNIKKNILQQAVDVSKYVNYVGIGTVEFLVSEDGQAYFLEVNPRVQVEHTVTEMVTGVDLLQASILVAAGVTLDDQRIGIKSQDEIICRGAAIQCRITTEDPLNNFAPDTGRIIAYRPAAGFGIRLDDGIGTSGGEVTPHYDSLLVKVTSFGKDLPQAANKMHRSLSEFRIRGVKHNISLLKNVVKNNDFLAANINTSFFETHPDLFKYNIPRDRATKILNYIGEVTINDPHGLVAHRKHLVDYAVPKISVGDPELQEFRRDRVLSKNAKEIFDEGGVDALKTWIRSKENLLLTDTTMRDAHQSLFATRLRSKDIFQATAFYREYAHQFFSLEVWGGATFDTSLRFLKEDPWERLAKIREQIPNVLLQMLLRGDNAVGYTNYPKWVIQEFIKETVQTGLDVFRIFDCLNQPHKMKTAIEEVKKQGAIAEVALCYTGNVIDPRETKYTLKYYLSVAKELEKMGADILCIKDMAGLLRPNAAKKLITELKEHIDLPIHLHTHDTSGIGVSMQREAAKAGCDIIDGAVSSMSGLTSQPSLNALVASLEGNVKYPEVPMEVLDRLARYWEGVRNMYQAFDPGVKSTSTGVYTHEIPGGQYSNLYDQALKVGLTSDEFYELTKRYKEVNDLFGNIIKVTPSSKVVGDMALLFQKHGITGESFLSEKPVLDYPDSVISFFKGHMGVPYGGFREDVRKVVLGEDAPPPQEIEVDENDSLETVKAELSQSMGREVSTSEALSSRLYPKVFKEFISHRNQFGKTDDLPTTVFFHGLQEGLEIETDLEPGKTLIISLDSITEPNENGKRYLFYNLNGFSRKISVLDQKSDAASQVRPQANTSDPRHVGAAMPGKVLEVKVKLGDKVEVGQVLLVTESMKMEYAVSAKLAGVVKQVHVKVGEQLNGGDLLVEID